MNQPAAEFQESRQIELEAVDPGPGRAILRVAGVRHSRRSFQVRFFIDAPDANAGTPVEGNDRFGGDLWVYGHGMPGEEAVGEEAVLEGFVPEAGKVLEPFTGLVDLTEALAGRGAEGPLRLTLVVVDEDGRPMPHETFKFDRARLEVQPPGRGRR